MSRGLDSQFCVNIGQGVRGEGLGVSEDGRRPTTDVRGRITYQVLREWLEEQTEITFEARISDISTLTLVVVPHEEPYCPPQGIDAT